MPTLADRKAKTEADLAQARQQTAFWSQRVIALQARLELLTELEGGPDAATVPDEEIVPLNGSNPAGAY